MKDTAELLKKVRKIEIKTRRSSDRLFAGSYHSAFKGRGMVFSEVREYLPGDDIRTIDWNVTARFDEPYVKVFEEEREITVILLVDMSGSGDFGSRADLKREVISEVSAILSFSAIQNNDKIGVVFFTDRVEHFIPPKKGKTHILRIIRELLEFEPASKETNIAEALRYYANIIKKRSVGFLLSDFMDSGYEQALRIAARKHDLVALRIGDEREADLAPMGMVRFVDPETGETRWLNTASKSVRNRYKAEYLRHKKETDDILKKAGVDKADIRTGDSYVQPLLELFKRRAGGV